jgi:hypothetical protein
MQDRPEQVRRPLAPPTADAYPSTFRWALMPLALSLIPALLRLRGRNTPAGPAAASVDPDELRGPEPGGNSEGH